MLTSVTAAQPVREDIALRGGQVSRLVWPAEAGAPHMLFSHANGFNAGTYRRLLGRLSPEIAVIAQDLRGHGATRLEADPARHRDWRIYRDDIIAHAEAIGGPIILAGHSMGGTSSTLAAAERPDLVRALILAEPVFLPRWVYWQSRMRHATGQRGHHLEIAKRAVKRRGVLPSRAAALESYFGRGIFKTIDRDVLADYIEAGFRDRLDGAVELACAPAWEAANFSAHAYNSWRDLPRVACPILIVLGAEQSTTAPGEEARVRAIHPQAEVHRLPGTTHLMPLEAQAELAALIADFVRRMAR